MKRFEILITAAFLALTLPGAAFAQEDGGGSAADNEELKVIEVELEKSAPAEPMPETMKQTRQTAPDTAQESKKPVEFSDLGQLSPFAEVSVIQKRFLPKTGRFQLFGGLTMVTNDPFFNVYGAVGKAGYFFSESIGLELNYFALSTNEAKATQELKSVQGVKTDNLVITKSVWAIDAVFVPIYGKMTWFNKKIVPFDLYFSTGFGATGTQNESPGTLHLATGQIFALSKSTAFRWDFSWNFFSAKGVDENKTAYNNLFLTAGWSWFFPEAKYR